MRAVVSGALTARDVETVFLHAAFGPLKAQGAPFWILRGTEVAWANRAALALFGVEHEEALGARLFAGGDAAAERLRMLVLSSRPGTAPRLERLRLAQGPAFGPAWRGLTLLHIAARGPSDEPLLGVGVIDAVAAGREEGRRAPWWLGAVEASAPAAAETSGAPPAPAIAEPALGDEPGPVAEPDAEASPETAADAGSAPSIRAAFGGRESVRLRWRSDAQGRLAEIEAAALERLQASVHPAGTPVAEVLAGADPAGASRLAEALARQETFSNLPLTWQLGAGRLSAPVLVGATPVLEAGRRFAGYRGFCTIHLAALAAVERDADTPAPPAPVASEAEPVAIAADPHETARAAEPAPLAVAADAAPAPLPSAGTDEGASAAAAEPVSAEAPPAEPVPVDVVAEAEAAPAVTSAAPETAEVPHAAEGAEVPQADETGPTPAEADAGADIDGLILDKAAEPQRTGEAWDSIAEVLNAMRPQAANVVRLRPLPTLAALRPPAEPRSSDSQEPPAPAPANRSPQEATRPTPEPAAGAPGAAAEPASAAGRLTPEERTAFAEIGEALSAAAGVTSPPDAGLVPAAAGAAPRPAAASSADLAARGGDGLYAPWLDAIPEPLLLIDDGQPRFANRALLARLGDESLAAFRRRAVGLFVDGLPPDGQVSAVAVRAAAGSVQRLEAEWREVPEAGGRLRLLALRDPDTAGWATASTLLRLLDGASDALAALDDQGTIRWVNRRLATLSGHDRDRVTGIHVAALLAPESRTVISSLLADLGAQGERADSRSATRDVLLLRPDGAMLPVRATLARHGADGLCLSLRDVSAMQRAERDLARAEEEADRALGRQRDFLAKISHDIRTPLNAILGFAEVMMEERLGPLGSQRYKDYLKDIHVSGTHVMTMVNDLLDLSRIESGSIELEVAAVDLNKAIVDCVAQMQAQAHRERVIMRTSLSPRLPSVLADDRSVRQIVLNLLSNAVRYNQPGGQVIVSTAVNESGGIALRIRDTGLGMTESEVAAALEPFRQYGASTVAGSSGLGLPLTHALIGANGATLSIRSRPGEGTLVEVTFVAASLQSRVMA